MIHHTKLKFSSSSSSEDLNDVSTGSSQPPADAPEISMRYFDSFARALADEGFTYQELMKIHTFYRVLEEENGKVILKTEEFQVFAATVAAMSEMDTNALDEIERKLAANTSCLFRDYSTILHSLGVKGTVLVDPVRHVAVTTSPVFARYFMRSEGEQTSEELANRNSIKENLRDLRDLFRTRSNDHNLKYFANEIFAITGLDTFLSMRIDVSSFMKNKKVYNGTVRSSAPLPFAYPAQANTSKNDISRIAISKAVQDITGCIPVSLSSGASASQSLIKYEGSTSSLVLEDSSVKTFPDKTYFMPVTLASPGYKGDVHTTDLLFQWLNKPSRKALPSENISCPEYFSPHKDLGVNRSYTDVTRPSISLESYSLEETPPSKESKFWTAVTTSIGSPQVISGLAFLGMSYTKVSAQNFESIPGVKVMDFAGYCSVLENCPVQAREHLMVLLSSSSQTVLAIPKPLVTHSSLLTASASGDKIAYVSHTSYPILWKGIAKKLAPMASAFYVACVAASHRKPNVPLKDLQDDCRDIYFSAFSSKSRKKKIKVDTPRPSINMSTIMFEVFWRLEIRHEAIPLSPYKVYSDSAQDALIALSEVSDLFVPPTISDTDAYDQEVRAQVYKPTNFDTPHYYEHSSEDEEKSNDDPPDEPFVETITHFDVSDPLQVDELPTPELPPRDFSAT